MQTLQCSPGRGYLAPFFVSSGGTVPVNWRTTRDATLFTIIQTILLPQSSNPVTSSLGGALLTSPEFPLFTENCVLGRLNIWISGTQAGTTTFQSRLYLSAQICTSDSGVLLLNNIIQPDLSALFGGTGNYTYNIEALFMT